MATKDISRLSFDPGKHYSSVRMQQGRVMIDDDWNENERIENEDRRRARVEIVGPSGSPDQGFCIANPEIAAAGNIDFEIEPGSFYLGGLRLEIDQKETYRLQKDWLQQPSKLHPAPQDERYDLIYLEAWRQPVGAVEDGELFEVALGGADTSMRIRNMNRVRLEPGVQANDCKDAWQKLVEDWKVNKKGTLNKENERVADASLQVTFVAGGNPDDLCTPLAAGGYLGAENQAIRVQIVDQTHLTWGFDNAAPLYRVSVNETGETVTLKTDPKDQAHWPLAGQTVEILPWSAVLPNGEKVSDIEGHLSKVESSYNPDTGEFTLTKPVPADFGKEWASRDDHGDLEESSFNFYMRVWNRGADQTSPEKISFTVGTPLPLGNTGLEITISGDEHISENYWIIAARPETPNKIIPWELEKGLSPNGMRRFFAPLAIIHWHPGGNLAVKPVVLDCRKYFPPLTGISAEDVSFDNSLCSLPDADTVQDALDILCRRHGGVCTLALIPGQGWEKILNNLGNNQDVHLCFQIGSYPLDKTFKFKNLGHLKISGCGFGTQVIASKSEAVFEFDNCKSVHIQDLAAVSGVGGRKALNGTLSFNNCQNVTVENVSLKCPAGTRKAATCITIKNRVSGASLAGGKGLVRIRHCDLSMGHLQIGILLVNVARAHIEDNYLAVAPKPKRLSFERLVQNKAYRAKFRKMLISDATIGTKADVVHKRDAAVSFGNYNVRFNTDDALAKDWKKLLDANPPKANRIKRDRDLLTHVERLADRILLNKGVIIGSPQAKRWYELLKQQHPAVASQGIVVGGRIVTDIRIINNTIHGVLEGVHVGVSRRASPQATHDVAGRLKIEDNTIGITLAPVAFRERYGIFVGNCNSCIIENNYIRAKRFLFTIGKHIEGIRIFGYLGRMMIVRKNHLENFTIGTYINPLNEISKQLFQWVVTNNISPNARIPLEIGERPKPGESEAEKQRRLQRNAEKEKKVRQQYNYT